MYDGGECIIFPSKKMRDWSKFAWKKGDILISQDKNIHLIFEKFIDDTYTIFAGKHCYEKDYRNEYNYEKRFDGFKTEYFTLETGDAAQKYLKTIEEKLGGKLNRWKLRRLSLSSRMGTLFVSLVWGILLMVQSKAQTIHLRSWNTMC